MSQSISLDHDGRREHVWSLGSEDRDVLSALNEKYGFGEYHLLYLVSEDDDARAPIAPAERTAAHDIVGAQLTLQQSELKRLRRLLGSWKSAGNGRYAGAVQAMLDVARTAQPTGALAFQHDH